MVLTFFYYFFLFLQSVVILSTIFFKKKLERSSLWFISYSYPKISRFLSTDINALHHSSSILQYMSISRFSIYKVPVLDKYDILRFPFQFQIMQTLKIPSNKGTDTSAHWSCESPMIFLQH